jgi:O-antigen ligase
MKNLTTFTPQRLLKPLCLLVLVFIPLNMLFSPIFDFFTNENRGSSWTVTMTAYAFILTAMPFLIVPVLFMRSRNEKLILRSILVFFIYAFLFTMYSAQDLFYPMYGLVSLLGTTLVAVLFYVSARGGIVSAKEVFQFFVVAAALVVVPMLLVQTDPQHFAELSAEFGANTILYGYENPRPVGWVSTISLSLLTAYVMTKPNEGVRPIFLLLIVIASMTLFWSGSRGGIITFSTGILFVLFFSKTKNMKGILLIVVLILVGGTFSHFLYLPGDSYGIFVRIGQTLEAKSIAAASTGRAEIWQNVFLYILERPFLGYGYLPHKSLEGLAFGSAHNIIMDLWLGFGLIIGTIVILFGVMLWARAFDFFRKANDQYISALFCVVTTLLVYSMVSGPYARTFPLLLFAVSFGVILGRRSSKANMGL